MDHRRAAAAVLALLLVAVLPAAVAAHSDLVSSSPPDGAVLTGPPLEITGDFSEALDATRSVLELRAPGGSVLATGGVPNDGPATRMAIADLPAFAPGTYEVRWTTVTADDGGVERGIFSFTLSAATPGAAAPGASATTSTTPTPAPVPTPALSAAPSPAASPAASPAPSPAPGPGSAADLLVPLVVLAGVLAAGAAWLLRRRR